MQEAISREESECAACGVVLTADASFCQGCGAPVPGAPVPDTFDGRSSGTCCRGCGASLDARAVICPVCGRRATRRRKTPRAAAGGATLMGVSTGRGAVLEELDALLADRTLRLLVLLERSGELLDRCRVAFRAEGLPLFEIASHPSRARVPWHAVKELLGELAETDARDLAETWLARLDTETNPSLADIADELAEALLVAAPEGNGVIVVDRAHRLCGRSQAVLTELAKLGVARVVLRAPTEPRDLTGAVTRLLHPDLGADPGAPGRRAQVELTPAAREVLHAAAVLGWRARIAAIETMLERPIADEPTELEAHGLLERVGDELVFSDPDVADAIEDAIPAPERQALHDGALAWYAGSEAPLELRAEHAARAGDLSTAVLLLDMLARVCVERRELSGALEALTRGLDRIRTAALDGEEAVSRAGARLARHAAELLLKSGDHRTAEGLLREALERPALPVGEKAALTMMAGAVAVGRGRHDDARLHLERASEWASASDNPKVTADAELWLAQLEATRCAHGDVVADHVRRAWAILADLSEPIPARTAALAERVLRLLAKTGEPTLALDLLDALLNGPASPDDAVAPRLLATRQSLMPAS
ncbi:MAG: zinc ribbon domain-containing protein [Myxococcota bacterium]|nr:zinc ribbon domain-containing protein [Myxococcota bacterium]